MIFNMNSPFSFNRLSGYRFECITIVIKKGGTTDIIRPFMVLSFYFRRNMGYNIDYLLRYVSMDTYNKIINSNNDYVLGLLSDNYIDVNLNIKYLIKYGVSNIDKIVYNNINDFIVSHSEFINVIKNYEKSLSKDEIIMLYENK